ncbi:MAG: transporter substrate-binding domain-containing protein, partial [Deltaproteobacteria bacterium]|nr:transporter substrate-binding domain-containing protein [Deltaproteobacteria bacterium]
MRRSYARMSAILESLGAIVITILIVVPAAGPDDSDCNPLLTQQESRWLAEHDGRIRYAPCPDFAPVDFVDEDGIHRGITADYVELLEQKLRFKFKKVYCQSWEEMIQKARAKEIDVISSIQETPERREYLEFTRPYVTIPVAIIVRKEVEGSLDPRRMHGMRVAMVKGYASLDFVKREYPDLLIDPVQTNPEGLKMVSFGRADAMIENLAVATYYIQKLGITNLRVAGFIDFKWNLRFGSRNDWPVLSQILDKGLASVSSGEAHSIYTKWISLGGESVFASRKFWTSIAVALSVVLLTIGGILTWNRTLRRQVEQRNAQLQQEFAERERAQAALRDSEERYRTLFEGSSDAIMVVRPEGEIVDANPSAGELFGVPRPELLGADILQFYCDPAERATLREVVDTKGFTRNHEWNIKRRDGQERKCL